MDQPAGLRVLITNNTLDARAGSEIYVRDLAVGLMRRGHWPVVYSSVLGAVAEDLRRASVPVVDGLSAVGVTPDVIHGQHHMDAMCAMLRFPEVPAVFMCHGWQPWEEAPPVFPSIRRYIAVDDLCRERIVTTAAIDPAVVRTIYNSVDMERFRPRPALPARPLSALVFSNTATDSNFAATIRAACEAAGIPRIDVVGFGVQRVVDHPERLLPQYDIVFAKARCALEALATGCAVVVADAGGLAGMVTPTNLDGLRRLNFGVRTLQAQAVTIETIRAAIGHYHPVDCATVTARIRQDADSRQMFEALIGCYADVVAAGSPWSASTAAAFSQAAASYLAGLASVVKQRQRVGAVGLPGSAVGSDAYLPQEMEVLVARLHASEQARAAIEGSATWRLFAPYRRLRALLRR